MAIKIKIETGNLLSVKSGHIVHGCNAQGVMGSGVALAVKQTYPGAYEDYIRVFNSDPPFRGTKLGVAYPYIVNNDLVIWNAITQDSFGGAIRQVSYDAIQTCFEQINWHIKEGGTDNVAFAQAEEVHIPMIGAARGGGNWKIISTIIEETMDFPVTLWLPDSTVTTL